MLLSLNWLKDFVDIPRSVTPEELGLRLTIHTVEIDSVEKQSEKYENVVVGEILKVKKHPNADKLQVAIVDAGKHGNKLNIVCGALNIEAGQKVPVALSGAVLSGGFEIKQAEIRGERSEGMLCAEDELGLGDDHSGIMILDSKTRKGQDLFEYLNLKDVLFEVDNKSVTHRPDLWGHYGIARETAAFLKTKTTKEFERIAAAKIKTSKESVKINVKISDHKLCPRYMAAAMSGITVEPSPKWMRDRLIAVGTRPINNIVDITNYVMLELGQPMHAFDAGLIPDNKITVRTAGKDEIIKTLDGDDRELDEDMLLITDGKKPIAIAGVMGGENSEINENTNTIVLESANFDFVSIRKTSTKLGLRTEASKRFEKGLDPNLCETALARAVELINKICPGAEVASSVSDAKKFELDQGPIELDLDWLNRYIGEEIPKKKTVEILEKLGFTISAEKDRLLAAIPTWRATKDVSIKEDLAEEVSRIYGYDNMEPKMPLVNMKVPAVNEGKSLTRRIKNILSGAPGLSEVSNYSFTGEEQLEKLGIDFKDYIRLANPISTEHTMLRQNLAPNLILNIKTNQARYESFGIFEIGSVYLPFAGGIEKGDGSEDSLPYQEKRLGILCAGGQDGVFNRVKGCVEFLFSRLNILSVFSETETVPNWARPRTAAQITVNNKTIGFIYKLNKKAGRKAGIKQEASLAELNLSELEKIISGKKEKNYEPLPKYPPVTRDLAFVVNEKVLYNDIKDEILNFHEYVSEAELFDVYLGEKLGKGNKSLAFHIVYRGDKTLTAEEVDGVQERLIKHLENKFEAKVRDF